MPTCELCKKRRLNVSVLHMSVKETKRVCAICALKERNKHHHLPENTPFKGHQANLMLEKEIVYEQFYLGEREMLKHDLQREQAIHEELLAMGVIAITWGYSDVQDRAKAIGLEISAETALEILKEIKRNIDNEVGVTWEILEEYVFAYLQQTLSD